MSQKQHLAHTMSTEATETQASSPCRQKRPKALEGLMFERVVAPSFKFDNANVEPPAEQLVEGEQTGPALPRDGHAVTAQVRQTLH